MKELAEKQEEKVEIKQGDEKKKLLRANQKKKKKKKLPKAALLKIL